MAATISASEFRNLRAVPTSLEEVIWPDLDAELYQESMQALAALTAACQDTNSPATSFYVGAGISVFRPSYLPVAKTVLKSLFEQAAPYCLDAARRHVPLILETVDQGGYVLMENVFQQLYETIHPRPFQSGRIFDVPTSPPSFNLNHIFLAKWLHSGRGTVATTNLDPLIEHAWRDLFPDQADGLTTIQRPEQFQNWESRVQKPDILWKLHGSSDDAESWAITLAKVGFPLGDARAGFIDHLIQQRNVCFIGYRAADLDLFPVILKAHAGKQGNSREIFWVFYFQEGYKTLGDYLAHEANIRHLFEANRSRIHPIITTAERLTTWLQAQCLNDFPAIPLEDTLAEPYDYERWLKADLETIQQLGVNKLVGITLRTVNYHDEALEVLDAVAEATLSGGIPLAGADSQLIRQAAQMLQESANTSWQQDDVIHAREKVERAWKLLSRVGIPLERAWCQYGRVTMPLDAKHDVSLRDRILAGGRLLHLHGWFHRIAQGSGADKSPMIGEGLCVYYETKVMERVSERLHLLRLRSGRQFLIRQYDLAEYLLRKSEFLASVPDIKRRKALLRVSDDPQAAVDEMTDALRVAQVVGHSHYELTRERAKRLIERIVDPDLRVRLFDAIGEPNEDGET